MIKIKNMGSILNFHVIICLTLLYVEVAYTIYDPSVTTTKPPKRRESLPWYLSGENAQPPPDFLVPPESSGNTNTWSDWRKYPESEIEQRTEIHKTVVANNKDDDRKIDQKQYKTQHESMSNSRGRVGEPHHVYIEDIKTKNRIPAEQSLYEGVTDDKNKPRKEAISGINYHPQPSSNVAKYDRETGVECPFPDATGQFIYPVDCKFFVNCWKGRAFVQPCTPGTHFNPETLECDYPHKVKCYGGELADFATADYKENVGIREPLSNRHSAIHASSDVLNSYEPSCSRQMTGLLPHPGDCTKFLQCANGDAIVMDCGPGTVFNPRLSVCDHPRNVRGCEDVTRDSDQPSSVLAPPGHSSSNYRDENNQNTWNPVLSRQVVQTVVCPDDFTGISPHPTDCKKFLQCAHGATFIMDCGPGTVFNPRISVCDWPYNVPGCGEKPAPTYRPSYNRGPWQDSIQGNNRQGHDNWHGNQHAPHGQPQHNQNRPHNYHHHYENQPTPCHHPGCSTGRQSSTGIDDESYVPTSHHNNRHNYPHQNKPWSNLDPYSRVDNGQPGFTSPPTNAEHRPNESPYNHDVNYPNRREYPVYSPSNRGTYGRSQPDFSHPGGNVYVDNGYRPPTAAAGNRRQQAPGEMRPVWIPNAGRYGGNHDSRADESGQYDVSHTFGGYDNSQRPVNSDGEYISSGDVKLDSWLSKPNVIGSGDKGKELDTKLDTWSSKTNIFNQGREQVGAGTKNAPSGIYVNVNGIKGHYITKEIEIHQDHSNTRHYTPSIPSEISTHTPTSNHDTFNNRESFKREFNYTQPNIHSSNEFNPNQPRWRPIVHYNNTHGSEHDEFNQSHDVRKPQNKTNSNPHISTEPIDKHITTVASDYDVRHDETTVAPTSTVKKTRPIEDIPDWLKPDTNVPSVSISGEEHDENYNDETGVLPDDNQFQSTDNGHGVIKFEVDVLDEGHKWKPHLANGNKNKKGQDSSVIMKINKKVNDLELFNVESAPWQEDEPSFPVYYIPPVYSLEHSDNSKPITPSSGQFIRLRGGTGASDGYVEAQGIQPGWGVVCDVKNSWTVKEADIVCRQLGYTRGAETAWQGRTITRDISSWIATTSVHCRGNETKFQTCKFDHGIDCNIERDAVGVRCLPNLLAYCHKDEIPHGGNCYHLADSSTGLNHAEALNYCTARNSRLVDITTQMENNFLSDWLMMNHSKVESIMTSGIGFTTFNRDIWLWEDAANAKFKFTKWWPGWKENVKAPSPTGSRPVCIIMKKKYPCYERPDSNCVADYFFWDVEDCATSMKGHSYVCKRPYDDISCIYGKGHQYSGNANVSASGKPCLPWNDESVAYPLLVNVLDREVREKLKAHNFCRNPNPMKESRPWCFTGFYGEQEQCDIPPCGSTGTVRSPAGGQCKKGHFECMPEECIPSHWVCDGEEDCANGRDENSCFQHLEFFKRLPRYRLDGHDVEKWLNTPAMTCALRCKEALFTCRSFSHKSADNLCLLSDNNVGTSGALTPTTDYDYYEMTDLSINCDEMFTCKNKKCINQTDVCDGKNDCGDRSDESCTVADLDYDIRLAGSENDHEGRVEVKFLGHWGQVCDDGFGMINAEIICRELGFALGAFSVRPGGFFGNLEPPTRFMVDQLKCRGNETSLRECEFDGWGVHDCLPEEAVGIVCKTAVNTCPEGQWKCDDSPTCIPSYFICDEVVDCPDGSDESPRHCTAPFEMRLANGSSPREGRVEIRHHGVWGTVCDDDFSNKAAKVVCKSLGYEGSANVKKNGHFGSGEGIIWLDDVFCHGNETRLYRCEHNHWGHNNCKHDEDVGVVCLEGSNNTDEDELVEVTRGRSIDDILPSDCGKRVEDFGSDEYIFERVVRGSIAPKDSYPWQASIRIRGHSMSSHWCGAVVISPLHVLTAAHCLKGYNKGTYFVRAGDYNTEIPEDTEVEANIEDYYIHDEFRKGQRMNNDIALVLLKGRGIPLGEHIMPICLPPASAEYPTGLNCTISGFGSIETGQSAHSRDLRFGWVPLIDQSICRADYIYGEGRISQGMFCAGYLDEGVDSCDGDSGGPLACQHNGAFTLYGITSWGQHCGKANKPGVYVRVAHYRDWIDKKIRDSLSGR